MYKRTRPVGWRGANDVTKNLGARCVQVFVEPELLARAIQARVVEVQFRQRVLAGEESRWKFRERVMSQ